MAGLYHISIDILARANRMRPPYRADVGRELEIPSLRPVVIPPYLPYREVGERPIFRQAGQPVTRMDEDTAR